jgi:hypothetical protein
LKPYHIVVYGLRNNRLTDSLYQYVVEILRNPPDYLDSPAAMEDMVSEWLGLNLPRYRGCKGRIVTLVRPFQPQYAAEETPCCRIYYVPANGYDLDPVIFVGFADE